MRLCGLTAWKLLIQTNIKLTTLCADLAAKVSRSPASQNQTGYGGTVNDTIAYDTLHVNTWLDGIDGKSPVNSSGSITGFPALMGVNFQSVSVAQKTVECNNDSSLSTGSLQAMDFVDESLGKIMAKLKSKGL